jgi:thiol-disulfide isomerase/thioredoxin
MMLRVKKMATIILIVTSKPAFTFSTSATPIRLAVRSLKSVSGTIYRSTEDAPNVKLFTKEGCTLCDKVKETLYSLHKELPHSLEAIDITDETHTEWYDKYKYDIPVLHINGQYWVKHRLSEGEARKGLHEARMGIFEAKDGEPNVGEMERKQAARRNNS